MTSQEDVSEDVTPPEKASEDVTPPEKVGADVTPPEKASEDVKQPEKTSGGMTFREKARLWGILIIAILVVLGIAFSLLRPQAENALLWGDFIRAPVPKVAIPANTRISLQDIQIRRVPIPPEGGEIVIQEEELRGKMAVKNLQAGKPILRDAVDEPVELLVPRNFIAAGTTLIDDTHPKPEPAPTAQPSSGGDDNALAKAPTPPPTPASAWEKKLFGAKSVTTDTLMTLEQIVPPDKVSKAAVHLLAGQPVTKGMVIQGDPPAATYVASKTLSAYSVVTEDDRQCNVNTGDNACAEAFDPVNHLLLGVVSKGETFPRAKMLDTTKKPAHVVQLIVSAPGAQSGTLEPGSMVDIYAAERVSGTQEISPVLATSTGVAVQPYPALLLAAEPNSAGYRVTLGLGEATQVGAIMEALPRADFYLVLRPDRTWE